MKRFTRAASLFAAAAVALGLLAGCRDKTPAEPVPAAVSPADPQRGLFLQAEELPLTGDPAALEAAIDSAVSFAAENRLNTLYLEVFADGGACYRSEALPLHPALLDEKGNPTGTDLLQLVTDAAAAQNIQVYAVLDPLYIAASGTALPEGHPAQEQDGITTSLEGALCWNLSNPEARSPLLAAAREVSFGYGTAGIVYAENALVQPYAAQFSAYPEALSALVSESKAMLAELGTGKRLAVCGEIRAQDSTLTTSPGIDLPARLEQAGAAPDYLLATLRDDLPGEGAHAEMLAHLRSVCEGTGTVAIPVLDLTETHDGDPYWASYRVLQNLEAEVEPLALRGYSAATQSPYYPALAIAQLYEDPAVYDVTVDTGISAGFAVTRPEKDITTGYGKYFLCVIADPTQPLYFGGEELATTAHGLAGVLVPLEYGENSFTFTQGDESRTVTLTRPRPAEGGGSNTISVITAGSMYPTTPSANRVGEEITLRCVAPAGSRVTASVAGQEIALEQAVATAQQGVAATYTGTAVFRADAAEDEVLELGPVTYTLDWNGSTTAYQSKGSLYAVGADAEPVLEVADYMAGVTVDDTAEHEGDFLTTLIEGSREYVDLAQPSNTHFFLRSGGAIRKEAVTLLTGSGITAEQTLSSVRLNKTAKGELFIFEGGAGAPWHAELTEDALTLTLYNTYAAFDEEAAGDQFALTGVMQNGDALTLTFTAQGGSFWGYDVAYEDGDLTVYCKQKPALSADEGAPLSGLTVLLDPGHGGTDPGTLGVAFGYGPTEDDINMAAALSVQDALERMGAEVVLTLSPDELSEGKRVLFERMQIAREHDADLFLSLHHNSIGENADGNKASGIEIYYFTDHSQALAEHLAANLSAATGRPNRGAEQSYYVVTKMTYCPAVLCELGFLVNPAEYEDVVSPEGRYRTANAILQSIFEVLA